MNITMKYSTYTILIYYITAYYDDLFRHALLSKCSKDYSAL